MSSKLFFVVVASLSGAMMSNAQSGQTVPAGLNGSVEIPAGWKELGSSAPNSDTHTYETKDRKVALTILSELAEDVGMKELPAYSRAKGNLVREAAKGSQRQSHPGKGAKLKVGVRCAS